MRVLVLSGRLPLPRAGGGPRCELEVPRRVMCATDWPGFASTSSTWRASPRATFRAAVSEEDRDAMLRAVPAVPVALVPDGRDGHSWDDAARALVRCCAAAVDLGAIEHPAAAVP
jgi:hypothetical protein